MYGQMESSSALKIWPRVTRTSSSGIKKKLATKAVRDSSDGKMGTEGSGDRTPKVAVAVFIIKGSSVLLGKRLSSIGKDAFALPGGRLEFGESFEDCAKREVKEETGVDIERVEVMKIVNSVFLEDPKPAHFVTILVRAVLSDPDQVPVNVEPDKCDGWGWYEWDCLPDPLFKPLKELVMSGFSPLSSPPHLVLNVSN